MAYPQYNSVEEIDPSTNPQGRWKGFMVTDIPGAPSSGTVVFTTLNNETRTMRFVAKDLNVVIPIGIKKFLSSSTATGIYGLN